MWIEYLCITDHNLRSGLFTKPDAGYARHLLSQVIKKNIAFQFCACLCLFCVYYIYRGIISAYKFRFPVIYCRPRAAKPRRHGAQFFYFFRLFCNRWFPFTVIKIREGITCVNIFFCSVVLLSQEKACISVRSISKIFPLFCVSCCNDPAAVLISHLYFCQQCLFVTKIIIILHNKGLRVTPPAGGDGYTNSVPSGPKLVRDIIGLVIDSFVILSKPRIQQTFCNLLPVNAAVIDSSGSYIKPRPLYFLLFVHLKDRSEHRYAGI